MHRLSMEQALSLWSDLDDAFYKDNSFGGDTAELYVYRFMPSNPTVSSAQFGGMPSNQWVEEAYVEAGETMVSFLSYYAKKRECEIIVNDEKLGPWLATGQHRHRIHVRVVRKGDPHE